MREGISLAGRSFVLDVGGAIFCEVDRLLIVSDMHLETGSAFARRGALLPPYDSMATLARLATLLGRLRPRAVVSLGDGFHDGHGPRSLTPCAFDTLRALMQGREWLWVVGNHDRRIPLELGGAVLEGLDLGGVTLRHIPGACSSGPEIAGHLHPKGRIAGRRLRLSRPCFLVDPTRLVLPAFGVLTGGLNALDPAVRCLFAADYDAWLLGEDRIFRVPHRQLVAEPMPVRPPWV